MGTRSARFTLVTPLGEAEVALALPGLYNVYNALGAAALAVSLGASLADVVAGLQAASAAFGRAESVTIGATELSILLIKNPACANQVLRTLSLEDGELDLLLVLNDLTADGRDVSWIWDADFEVIAAALCGSAVCAGTRAAELALRLKYARRPRWARLTASRLVGAGTRRRADAGRRAVACSLLRPTPRCSSLREEPGLGEIRRRFLARGRPGVSDAAIWTARMRLLPCGHRCLADARSSTMVRPCWTSAPEPDGSRGELARAGHDVVALDLDGELLDELARRIAREPEIGARVRTVRADARDFDARRALPADPSCRCRRSSCSRGHAGRVSFLWSALRAHLAPDGTTRGGDRDGAGALRGPGTANPGGPGCHRA